MERKDFKKIAFVLGQNRASQGLIEAFCKMMAEDNPNFKRDQFTQAINEVRKEDQESVERPLEYLVTGKYPENITPDDEDDRHILAACQNMSEAIEDCKKLGEDGYSLLDIFLGRSVA